MIIAYISLTILLLLVLLLAIGGNCNERKNEGTSLCTLSRTIAHDVEAA